MPYTITEVDLEELSNEIEAKAKALYWRGFFHGTLISLGFAALVVFLVGVV